MKILIIEDDHNKLDRLRGLVSQELTHAEVKEARAYQKGLRLLRDWRPDLLLLDMSMPTYEVGTGEQGGRPRSFGGRQILHEMRRRKIGARVIIVTQFDVFGDGPEQKTLSQLKLELATEFRGLYVGAVYYDPAASDWGDDLRRMLNKAKVSR